MFAKAVLNANGEMTTQNIFLSFPLMYEKWQANKQYFDPVLYYAATTHPGIYTTKPINLIDIRTKSNTYNEVVHHFSFLSDYLISYNIWRSRCPYRRSH